MCPQTTAFGPCLFLSPAQVVGVRSLLLVPAGEAMQNHLRAKVTTAGEPDFRDRVSVIGSMLEGNHPLPSKRITERMGLCVERVRGRAIGSTGSIGRISRCRSPQADATYARRVITRGGFSIIGSDADQIATVTIVHKPHEAPSHGRCDIDKRPEPKRQNEKG
jgi:hypothetical protein